MQVINAGTNEDGTPHLHYYAPGEHVVLTGPDHFGVVELGDGTSYDVTPRVVVVASPEHAAELAAALNPTQEG